ncbi:MAG: energy-coupling factor transporter transmembrane protein EcfT [Clostridiales bacterium]|jgi:energy-coupling factor transport system permease protein|nr:energy-coupling factor transporter transmembrane protein EcfT [Clostridiales bacterium]
MAVMHPVCLAASLAGSLAYSIYINRAKAIKFNLIYMLPMFAAMALINPAFNHEGGTILAYLRGGNPLTLESIAYGIAAAVVMITVINWFSCFSAVMTSDKFVYLFGRAIPALSLILSMALRLAPRFKAQIKTVSNSQKCVGRDISDGSVPARARHGIRILSIMVTWALENSIETADSMKCRGYGLKGRTAFSIYRFGGRDAAALAAIAFCAAYVSAGLVFGGVRWRYFPTVRGTVLGAYSFSVYACYLALCAMPVAINAKEDMKWRSLRRSA